MDAVEAAVRNMEDNSIFNAGHGCALTEENTAELDAFIMDGHNLATGYRTKIYPFLCTVSCLLLLRKINVQYNKLPEGLRGLPYLVLG